MDPKHAIEGDVDLESSGAKEGEQTDFEKANAYLKFAQLPDYPFADGTAARALTLREAYILPEDPKRARSVFDLTITEGLCNAGGNLHGGAVAMIFDMCTGLTIAPIAREGFWDSGHVSRHLNCTYLRPAPLGSECVVESEVVHLGKTLGFLRGVIKRKSDGLVLYTCEHDKALVNQGERMRRLTSKI